MLFSIANLLTLSAATAVAQSKLLNSFAQTGSQVAEFSGPTMGTRFTVKIFEPPVFDVDVRLEVDALLRHINDLMSTYLSNSEISRFNQSDSTDWFSVSSETAKVIAFAQEVSNKTSGAFDVTVGPLVNAWSFGPEDREQALPAQEEIEQILARIGYRKLQVRVDPPALKKSIPDLQVDLSAIAKGYAVDKVVELLNRLGANNVFVEIGGEVSTSGNKSGQPWQVGIQVPDVVQTAILIAQPLNTQPETDQAMATSGDYRNFMEIDGVRYSHTLDPRTGQPIDHDLASISVVAQSCMVADAWATALNVLGERDGNELAQNEDLSTLWVQRSNDQYTYSGTGLLATHAVELASSATEQGGPALDSKGSSTNQSAGSWMIMLITTILFGVIIAGMAVGVIFGRRAISGSCGGIANHKDEDGNTSCALCSNPSDACKDLRERMGQDPPNDLAANTDIDNG